MSSKSPDQFLINIRRFAQKAETSLETFAIVFIQDLNEELIIATPGPGNSIQVNPPPGQPTGFLRGSWLATVDDNVGALKGGKEDPTGQTTIAEVNMVAAGLPKGGTYYIVNTAKYAKRLEYGFVGEDSLGRLIDQAPRAFVRGTVAKAREIAERTAEMIQTGNMGGRTGGMAGGKFVPPQFERLKDE